VSCDNTGKLRPGNAGANIATDHLDVLAGAIAQIPAPHRRHLLIRGESATSTHVVLDWLTALNTSRRRVGYSLGWSIGEPERAAIGLLTVTHNRSAALRLLRSVPARSGLPAGFTRPDRAVAAYITLGAVCHVVRR
jgi:hypothetical protein